MFQEAWTCLRKPNNRYLMANTMVFLSNKYLHTMDKPTDLKLLSQIEFESLISNAFMQMVTDNYYRILKLYSEEIKVVTDKISADLNDLRASGFTILGDNEDYNRSVSILTTHSTLALIFKNNEKANIAEHKLTAFEIFHENIAKRDKGSREIINKQFAKSFVALRNFFLEKYGSTKEMNTFLEATYDKNDFLFRLAGMKSSYTLENFNRFVRRHKSSARTISPKK